MGGDYLQPYVDLPGREGAAPSRQGDDEQWHRLLRALSRVSAALSGLSDLDAMLRIGLDAVTEILQADVGAILLLDPETESLAYRVHHGFIEAQNAGVPLSLGRGIMGRVAETGRAALLEDISPDHYPTGDELVAAENLKSLACVPLRAADKILGVMIAGSRASHQFNKEDIYVLHAIGDQMAIAVERAEVSKRSRKNKERYRRLVRHCLVAQEEERKRIAQELHDETSQSLSGLALNLRALVELAEMSGQDESFIERLRKVEALSLQTSGELTRLINDLRPTLLDTVGLIPAIRRYAQENLRPAGIEVSVESRGSCHILRPRSEVTIFRFVQGAISNIMRHSHANTAAITMDCQPDEIMVQIADDGQGFDVSKITGIDDSGRGRGVFTMKERIRLLGGSCVIQSKPGEGTVVKARIPVQG